MSCFGADIVASQTILRYQRILITSEC